MADLIPDGTGIAVRGNINAEFASLQSQIDEIGPGIPGEQGPAGVDGAPGTGIVDQNTQTEFMLWQGTQAEYDLITSPSATTIYFIY